MFHKILRSTFKETFSYELVYLELYLKPSNLNFLREGRALRLKLDIWRTAIDKIFEKKKFRKYVNYYKSAGR